MCIIIVKQQGVDLPKKSILETCFDNNPDGCGYMYNDSEGVHIRKGFMTYKAFEADFNKMSEKIDFKNATVVYHFRISTQAGVNKQCTHPYPLSNNMKDMKKLFVKADIGVAHNGIISLTSTYGAKDHNDTMEFITDYLSLIINDSDFYNNQKSIKLIKKLIGASRLAILDKSGHCTMIAGGGEWVHDKKTGLYFSNTTYKAKTYSYADSSFYKNYRWDYKTRSYVRIDKDKKDFKTIADYCNDNDEDAYCGTTVSCGNDTVEENTEEYGQYESKIVTLDYNGKTYSFNTDTLEYECCYGSSLFAYSTYGVETDKEGNKKTVDLLVLHDGEAYTIYDVFD